MEIQATRDTGILNFEKAYLNLRQKENRLFDDEGLAKLPKVDASHPHYHEWKSRKASCERLVKYLSKKKKQLNILEIGCGNGWLSHQLSLIPGTAVTGADINSFELEQARRVFGERSNLQFLDGELNSIEMQDQIFDIILFAASIQYFESFQQVIDQALARLKEEGEIHILDTHFYEAEEIAPAQKRSLDYFSRLGFPEMGSFYYHHGIHELDNFSWQVHYKPKRLAGIFQFNSNPFYWLSIKAKRS